MIRCARITVPCCFDCSNQSNLASSAVSSATVAATVPKSIVQRSKKTKSCSVVNGGGGGGGASSSVATTVSALSTNNCKTEFRLQCDRSPFCLVVGAVHPTVSSERDWIISSTVDVYFGLETLDQLINSYAGSERKLIKRDMKKFFDATKSVIVYQDLVTQMTSNRDKYVTANFDPFFVYESSGTYVSLTNRKTILGTPFDRNRDSCATLVKRDADGQQCGCSIERLQLAGVNGTVIVANDTRLVSEKSFLLFFLRMITIKRSYTVPQFFHWIVDVTADVFRGLVNKEIHTQLLVNTATLVANSQWSISAANCISVPLCSRSRANSGGGSGVNGDGRNGDSRNVDVPVIEMSDKQRGRRGAVVTNKRIGTRKRNKDQRRRLLAERLGEQLRKNLESLEEIEKCRVDSPTHKHEATRRSDDHQANEESRDHGVERDKVATASECETSAVAGGETAARIEKMEVGESSVVVAGDGPMITEKTEPSKCIASTLERSPVSKFEVSSSSHPASSHGEPSSLVAPSLSVPSLATSAIEFAETNAFEQTAFVDTTFVETSFPETSFPESSFPGTTAFAEEAAFAAEFVETARFAGPVVTRGCETIESMPLTANDLATQIVTETSVPRSRSASTSSSISNASSSSNSSSVFSSSSSSSSSSGSSSSSSASNSSSSTSVTSLSSVFSTSKVSVLPELDAQRHTVNVEELCPLIPSIDTGDDDSDMDDLIAPIQTTTTTTTTTTDVDELLSFLSGKNSPLTIETKGGGDMNDIERDRAEQIRNIVTYLAQPNDNVEILTLYKGGDDHQVSADVINESYDPFRTSNAPLDLSLSLDPCDVLADDHQHSQQQQQQQHHHHHHHHHMVRMFPETEITLNDLDFHTFIEG